MFVENFFREWNSLHLNEKKTFANKLKKEYQDKLDKIIDDIILNCPELFILMYYNDLKRRDDCIKIATSNIGLFKDSELLKSIMYNTDWYDELLKAFMIW